MDLEACIARISDYIVNIHIHDNDGKSDMHLPVGEGTVDFKHIIQSLKRLQYKDPLIIENLAFDDVIKSIENFTSIWNTC